MHYSIQRGFCQMYRQEIKNKQRKLKRKYRRIKRAAMCVGILSLAMSILSCLAVPMKAIGFGYGLFFAIMFMGMAVISELFAQALED